MNLSLIELHGNNMIVKEMFTENHGRYPFERRYSYDSVLYRSFELAYERVHKDLEAI